MEDKVKIEKEGFAGSLQSNDCLISVYPSKKIEIEIESPLLYEFGDLIQKTITLKLAEMGITGARVYIEDKGALDCTVAARLETAIRRAQ